MSINTWKRKSRNQSGQTLIIVFAVMVIALGIGMSASSRLIGALRNSSQIDLSARALAAAEAGAEQFLSRSFEELESFITLGNCGEACHITITGADGLASTINITLNFEGRSAEPFHVTLKPSEVSEIFLEGYPSNASVGVCLTETESGNPPMVMAAFTYGSAGSYQIENTLIESFGCSNVTGKTNPVSLRIKSVYEEIEASIVPQTGTELPSQGIMIESEAQINDVKRKVKVLKSYGSMPAEFNYVLYSKSETDALSN